MENELTPHLSKSPDSPTSARHRAMIAVELEVLAKKLDRFGWDRDRGTMAHDRLITDWMDALENFSLEEVKAACVRWVRDNPSKMPNEGHIRELIGKARRATIVQIQPVEAEPERKRVSPEQASAILSEAGIKVDGNGRVVGL